MFVDEESVLYFLGNFLFFELSRCFFLLPFFCLLLDFFLYFHFVLVEDFDDWRVGLKKTGELIILDGKGVDCFDVEGLGVVAVSVLELYFFVELFQKSNIGVDVVNFFGNEGDCLLFDELEDVGVLVPDDLFDLLMFVGLEDNHLELHP